MENCGSKKFDDFSNLISSIACVYINNKDWKESICLCITYQKTNSCIHIMGLCMRLGIVKATSEAIEMALGKKKKRGPKSKAKGGKALIIYILLIY